MDSIPKIIHQIWSGEKKLPDRLKRLSDTWKRDYPDWKYELWDNARINSFIKEYYPDYWYVYCKYQYNIERWDAVRYLILEKYGGMYVDFDYESVKSMQNLLNNRTCCFALEKDFISNYFRIFNNALMLCTPSHPFMQRIVRYVFSRTTLAQRCSSKQMAAFNITGPYALIRLYDSLTEDEKKDIYLIPANYVSPFTGHEAEEVLFGVKNERLNACLKDAYAVHYYLGNWGDD